MPVPDPGPDAPAHRCPGAATAVAVALPAPRNGAVRCGAAWTGLGYSA